MELCDSGPVGGLDRFLGWAAFAVAELIRTQRARRRAERTQLLATVAVLDGWHVFSSKKTGTGIRTGSRRDKGGWFAITGR